MCMELVYRNSPSEFLVDIAYLAVNDLMLVNKTYMHESYLETYSMYDTTLWMRIENGNDIATVLLTYHDENSYLRDQLTDLCNEAHSEEYILDALLSNVYDMLYDAISNCGFMNTYPEFLLSQVVDGSDTTYIRTVDFTMHEPTNEDKHPFYDT